MAVCWNIVPVYLFAIFLTVQSQFYPNYNPYGYQGYQGYTGYTPYPYTYPQSYQPYQPYVSNSPSNYYYPYYYPVQNYPAYNTPLYNNQPYQTYYPLSSSSSVNYPSNQLYSSTGYSSVTQVSSNNTANQTDPYANIRTDIIDVDPRYFHYYKRFFNLEDNLSPTQVVEDSDVVRRPSYSPTYTVKTESKHTNYSSNPLSYVKNDVQTKSFTYKKTFTLDPNKKEDTVINLNFVNGVQVTDTPKEEVTTVTIPPDDDIEVVTVPAEVETNITATEPPRLFNNLFGKK